MHYCERHQGATVTRMQQAIKTASVLMYDVYCLILACVLLLYRRHVASKELGDDEYLTQLDWISCDVAATRGKVQEGIKNTTFMPISFGFGCRVR